MSAAAQGRARTPVDHCRPGRPDQSVDGPLTQPPTAGMPGAAPMVYDGSDLRRMQRCMPDHLPLWRLERLGGPGPLRGRLLAARSADVGVSLTHCTVPARAQVNAAPTNAYYVVLPTAGTVTFRVDDGPAQCGPFVISPGRRVSCDWTPGRPALAVRLSRRLVERAWQEVHGTRPTGLIRFEDALNAAAADTGLWESLARTFLASRESGLLGGSPSADVLLGRFFAHSLVGLQPTEPGGPARGRPASGPTAGTLPDGLPLLPEPLCAAQEFCRTHVGEQVTVAEVAAAAGVSVRRLQADFRSHLGTTPVGYLRQLRLAGAHAELQRLADGTGEGTVAEVALRWGFTHLGRFSGTYKEEFGQLPSQTAGNRTPPA